MGGTFIEIRDASRKVRISWHYNSNYAHIYDLVTNDNIGGMSVLLPAGASVQQFQEWIERTIDAVLAGYNRAAEA